MSDKKKKPKKSKRLREIELQQKEKAKKTRAATFEKKQAKHRVSIAERLKNLERSERDMEEANKKYNFLQNQSQYAGVRFSEDERLKVFEYYWRKKGNIAAVRRQLAEDKVLEDGRVPSHGTIRQWAEENNWNLVSMMVDEGLLEVLEFKNNPEISNFINQKASYILVLREISQNIYQRMMKPGDPLFPKNNKDAVATMKYLMTEIREVFPQMLDGEMPAVKSSTAAKAKPQTDEQDDESRADAKDTPDNVIDMAMKLAERGEEVSEVAIAREFIKNRKVE